MLDEFPWLCQSSPEIEGRAPGRLEPDLRTEPVLFILIGSDIAMMEALSTYEHPLFGRVKAMVVNPFDLGDTAEMMAGTDQAVAIDAQLVTGGYPRLCAEGCAAPDVNAFFERQLADENSDLVDVGRNAPAAEFPPGIQASRVLTAIGSGEPTFKGIGEHSGIKNAPLARSLELLTTAKRTAAVDRPVSLRRANDPPYRVADTYLRFWIRFIGPSLPDIARGRPDLALARVRESWLQFRRRAGEPLVRASLERLSSVRTNGQTRAGLP